MLRVRENQSKTYERMANQESEKLLPGVRKYLKKIDWNYALNLFPLKWVGHLN